MSDTRYAFAVEQNTNDIYADASGNLGVVRDSEAVGQHVRQRLQTYYGEWFLNNQVGMPWLEEILGNGYDPALAESIVKREILATDNVTSIMSFSIGIKRGSRGVNIRDVSVGTVYGDEAQV